MRHATNGKAAMDRQKPCLCEDEEGMADPTRTTRRQRGVIVTTALLSLGVGAIGGFALGRITASPGPANPPVALALTASPKSTLTSLPAATSTTLPTSTTAPSAIPPTASPPPSPTAAP